MGRYRLRSLASFLYLLPISCSSVAPAAKSRCCCVQPAALQTTLRLASVPTSIKAATHLDLEVVLTMLAANTPEQQGASACGSTFGITREDDGFPQVSKQSRCVHTSTGHLSVTSHGAIHMVVIKPQQQHHTHCRCSVAYT